MVMVCVWMEIWELMVVSAPSSICETFKWMGWLVFLKKCFERGCVDLLKTGALDPLLTNLRIFHHHLLMHICHVHVTHQHMMHLDSNYSQLTYEIHDPLLLDSTLRN